MSQRHRLLLFDIDGTLLDTGGAGAGALLDAAEEVLEIKREDLPPLDLAGATDGGVIRTLFADAGRELDGARVAAYCKAYLGYLEKRLNREDFPGRLMGGVTTLLERVCAEPNFSVGLLTGNLRRGAQLKLDRFKLLHHFVDGGFGDDGEERNTLGPVAVQRMAAATRRQFSPDQVIVIGDTPKDIACAHAMGARCLAVSTGKFDSASLSTYGTWKVEPHLNDVERLVEAFAA